MKQVESLRAPSSRRRFLQSSAVAAGATAGAALWRGALPVQAEDDEEDRGRPLSRGDLALLRFLSALEQIEADLWLQYAELGGIQDQEFGGGGNALYTNALTILDGDMAQYIHDNTDDEVSHHRFLNNYLASKGADPVDLGRFATLAGSQATGASGKPRLTNLMELTIDTSFWTRYRSVTNPDFDPASPLAQAVPSLSVGQHTAIPRNDNDTAGSAVSQTNPAQTIAPHLQAIAFTAGFHFASVEQGGTSLYATLAQQAESREVLRILVSIGGSETMHFQTWQDKAGNALPLDDTDPATGVKVHFDDLTKAKGETSPESRQGSVLQANLIMPEPTDFLSSDLGPVAIIRPSSPRNSGAVVSFLGFVNSGLFRGQANQDFFRLMMRLAEEADAARHRR